MQRKGLDKILAGLASHILLNYVKTHNFSAAATHDLHRIGVELLLQTQGHAFRQRHNAALIAEGAAPRSSLTGTGSWIMANIKHGDSPLAHTFIRIGNQLLVDAIRRRGKR